MKILYISCHAILEYDEVLLLSELGYDVFSAGVYAYPKWRSGMPRPGIDSLVHYPDLERMASTIDSSGGAIPQPLIDWADTIIFMHRPEWLQKNWEKLKHKRVIYRSIGQSVPHVERILSPLVVEGLQIIRYSPKERNILNYAGESTIIRFYKDENIYTGYTGKNNLAINFTQSIRQRGRFCHYEEITSALYGQPHKIYGTGNEDLGSEGGGEVSYEQMLEILRDSRVYVYGGTWPASYTLSFIEAFMTGIPIVAIGQKLAESDQFERMYFYEVQEFIQDGVNGYISDDVSRMRECVGTLMGNPDQALAMGAEGRKTAIYLFGKQGIKDQWREFLGA